jgi:hypothetical protein
MVEPKVINLLYLSRSCTDSNTRYAQAVEHSVSLYDSFAGRILIIEIDYNIMGRNIKWSLSFYPDLFWYFVMI